jgi:hypothetical protein
MEAGKLERHQAAAPSGEKLQEETITCTYKFVGEVHTETKTVPISSAEAKLYLSQQSSKTQTSPPSSNAVKLRPPFARHSAFDPNPPTKYPRAFSATKKSRYSDEANAAEGR